MGPERLEARVREFQAPIPLEPDIFIEEVMLMEGLADFLEATGLRLQSDRPDEFRATELGAYERLLDHVSTHKYYLGIERSRPVERDEAAVSWRENVFRPMVEAIRRSGILADFPERTETDLYLVTMDHLHHLRQQYGRAVTEEEAVQVLRAAKPAKAPAKRRAAAPRAKKATGTTPRRRKA